MAYSVTIDLHGQTVESAKRLLTARLRSLPKDVREVVVVHGYHGGVALQNMVRGYRHFKVEKKLLGLNQGETVFLIKQDTGA